MVALAMGNLEDDPNDPGNPTKKRIRLNPQDSQKWTVESLRRRILQMGDKHIISCFLGDRWAIESGNTFNGLWQYTLPSSDTESTGLLALATSRLRCLVEGDITVAERCMAQVSVAKTVSTQASPWERKSSDADSAMPDLPRKHGMIVYYFL